MVGKKVTMLATNPADAIEQLTGILNATNGITVWVGTLLNASLPSMNPQPAWYDAIDKALTASQDHSETWRSKTSPRIIDDMTSSFIGYCGAFRTAAHYAQQVLDTVATQGYIPNAGQIAELTQIFGGLQATTAQNKATVQKYLQAMEAYREEMESDHAAFQAALKAAFPQEAAAKAAIQQIQTQIQSIEIALAADNQAASTATVATGSALTSLVVGLTFASEFDPVAFGVGVISIGADIVIDAETQARVMSDLRQIQSLTSQLTNDQVQLGLLQGIISNLQSLSQGIQSALDTFDDFDDTWTIANLSLTYLLVALAQPEVDVRRIPDLNNLQDATTAWQTMEAYANKVQVSVLTSQPAITIGSSAAAASGAT